MRKQILRWVRVIILLLIVCLFSADSCSSGPTYISPEIVNVNISSLRMVVQAPTSMEIDQSYRIQASLVPQTGVAQVSSILKDKSKTVTSPNPLGTPNATLLNAFGPGYEPFATASLDASSFTVEPNNNDVKQISLEQPEVDWDWVVTPLYNDTQTIGITIWVQWIRTQSGGSTSIPPLTFSLGYQQVNINVDNPNDPNEHWISARALLNNMMAPVSISLATSLIAWLALTFWSHLTKKKTDLATSQKTDLATTSKVPPKRNRSHQRKRHKPKR